MKCTSQKKKARRSPGEETRHEAPPLHRRFGAVHVQCGTICVNCAEWSREADVPGRHRRALAVRPGAGRTRRALQELSAGGSSLTRVWAPSPNSARAAAQRKCLESASLQCVAPSTSDHSDPAGSASLGCTFEKSGANSEQAPVPAIAIPALRLRPRGMAQAAEATASSSFVSSSPLIPRSTSCRRMHEAAARPPALYSRRVPRAAHATRPCGSHLASGLRSSPRHRRMPGRGSRELRKRVGHRPA